MLANTPLNALRYIQCDPGVLQVDPYRYDCIHTGCCSPLDYCFRILDKRIQFKVGMESMMRGRDNS